MDPYLRQSGIGRIFIVTSVTTPKVPASTHAIINQPLGTVLTELNFQSRFLYRSDAILLPPASQLSFSSFLTPPAPE